MTERWNIASALRSGLAACNVDSGGSNGGSNGIGNNGSADFCGGGGGDSRSGTTFSAANGESGILRKTGHYHHHGGGPENFDDLLVFGYSCKVFRDDERARFIDQGRHLIPWMGDNQLKIDRYDARGALHDLGPYEPPPGGYQDRLEGLTAAEQKAEQLCEEERYYSMYNNEVEEEYYQEEALKREKMLGNQVPFNYDAPQPEDGAIVATVEDRTANSGDERDDDPYELPKNFEIPPDIKLPDTMKEHAIIEKTAKFIASQDAQMEILLKTKQANNPQFEFLTQGNKLFRYYRHVLLAFRTNQYPTDTHEAEANENGNTDGMEPYGETERAEQSRPKIVVPAIKYKPSVDCAYTQLISKITGAPIPTIVGDEVDAQAEAPINAEQLTSLNSEFDYYQESSASSASVEVKKVSTGLAGLVQYDSESGGSEDEAQENDDKIKRNNGTHEKDIGPFQGVIPPVTIQHVIDRTAIYVAKNGYSFEEALRVKNDPRFVFLNQAHEYYPYYAYLVHHRMMGGGDEISWLPQAAPPSPTNVTIRTETENGTVVETTPSLGIKAVHTAVPKVPPAPASNIQHQKLGAPVSFSLVARKTKEDGGTQPKTMAGLGGSEDEEENTAEEQRSMPIVEKAVSNKELQLEEDSKSPAQHVKVEHGSDRTEVPPTVDSITEDIASALLDETVEGFVINSSPVVSDVPPTPEPAISKEKQAERKKRANMFVNLIKLQPMVAGEEGNEERRVAPDEKVCKADATKSDPDEGSIHSVHSTDPSPKKEKLESPAPGSPVCTATTVIDDDDDDDDVVLVCETRPVPVRSRSRLTRSRSKHETRERRPKKKKSKSHHRSTRGKKKSKKKSDSRSRSTSRTRSDRSASRASRIRKRRSRSRRKEDRPSRSSSRSTENTASSRQSKRTSASRHGSRSNRGKRTTKRPKRASRSRSRTPEMSRTSKRSPPVSERKRKERPRSREPSQTVKRTRRSRSRSSHRNIDSDTENRHRRNRARATADGYDGYDDRYPPTRGRYWDC